MRAGGQGSGLSLKIGGKGLLIRGPGGGVGRTGAGRVPKKKAGGD